MSKICRVCKIEKGLNEFYQDTKNSDGCDSQCKDCKILYNQKNWIGRIIRSSRSHDKTYEREYKEAEYIDEEFINNQLKIQDGRCNYCAVDMQFGEGFARNLPLGISAQRIENKIAHTKFNCVLTCFKCNVKAQKVPHCVMLEYGLEIRSNVLKYCSDVNHIGFRVLASDQCVKDGQQCKICKNNYERRASKRRKI